MLKQQFALLAPSALIVAMAACGGESPSTTGEDEQDTQVNSAEGARTSPGDGVADERVATSESEVRRGGVRVAGARGFAVGGRVGGVAVGGARVGGVAARGGRIGGVRVRGVGFGGRRVVGVRRGWVNGVWAPGWGWANGAWVSGATVQYSCMTDDDCAAQLGPGVAVCSYEPTYNQGQCVAPGW
jgi:hypothetical protein